jgi:hypothetical protein
METQIANMMLRSAAEMCLVAAGLLLLLCSVSGIAGRANARDRRR